jgi:polysaccharide export outer membrane protein
LLGVDARLNLGENPAFTNGHLGTTLDAMKQDLSETENGLPRRLVRLRLPLARIALMMLAVSLSIGCATGKLYDASNLPPQFMAPRATNLENVDFSQLSRTVGDTELLYSGDVVEVTIATGLEVEIIPSWKLRIGENGAVDVPLVGSVQIAGMSLTQAERTIRDESIRRGKFVAPNVSLFLEKRRSNRITVVGAVKEPGTYEIPITSSDVLSALVAAGGLTERAGTIIEVRHPPTTISLDNVPPGTQADLAGYRRDRRRYLPPRTVRIDLEQPSNAQSSDLHLQDGSTVMVMKQPRKFFHVIGLVKKADQFEMPEGQDLRLLGGLALAGGRTLSIADKVHVIRQVPGREEPVVIKASVARAKRDKSSNIRLQAGDVISVEETPATFFVGTIREFIRVGFSSTIPGF